MNAVSTTSTDTSAHRRRIHASLAILAPPVAAVLLHLAVGLIGNTGWPSLLDALRVTGILLAGPFANLGNLDGGLSDLFDPLLMLVPLGALCLLVSMSRVGDRPWVIFAAAMTFWMGIGYVVMWNGALDTL